MEKKKNESGMKTKNNGMETEKKWKMTRYQKAGGIKMKKNNGMGKNKRGEREREER